MSHDDVRELARRIRAHVLRMTHASRASHVGSGLSMAEILAELYGRVLRVRPEEPAWPDRDRFIVSKGHAAAAVYAVLAERGFFPIEWLGDYYTDGARLCGHVTVGPPGVDHSTGSLGHGLSVATGLALSAKRDGAAWRAFALLSDGECDEGSVWEPAMFAAHHELDNLVAIVDYNKIQSLDTVESTLRLEPFADKWRAFGWSVVESDGNDVEAMHEALRRIPLEPGRPGVVIAHTVKGKGVSFMEGSVLWHYRAPDDDELQRALAEIGA